ncbi:hypothetical protein DICPUDRAFT_146676 [Dictyostelium purpureum]|uniref:Methyltransferase type 11 domain-containing protein n=1 Tax=Dictyostelium purpureum TaxID=5786 RepID=F0Z6K9_DICPU|nr:uncharacterized protein DICPUDRAFT_146676 [Dictyostelium purpureum]EGC40512.1 hypothetical protein DICPUDRAFT_146676 [Dictyostelium purpureum]|eukprot:XP_003283059.1 hypothetical protein DICPUDRAFT_146676 [Dictyostelium purpureum]
MDNLHKNAKAGFQTNEAAQNYVKGRPTYPIESVEYMRDNLGIDKDSVVVDLACGTGKFTQVLASVFNNVTAVEPSKQFIEQCDNVLKNIKETSNPSLQYKVIEGLATSIPVPDNSVDLLTTAQAFHWFSNIETIKEISRVLKPNGKLILVWNSNKEDNPEYNQIISLYRDKRFRAEESPSFYSGEWMKVFDEIKESPELKKFIDPNLDLKTFKHNHYTNYEKALGHALSISFISLLDEPTKEIFIKEFKDLFNSFELTKGNKDFSIVLTTHLYITKKPSLQ